MDTLPSLTFQSVIWPSFGHIFHASTKLIQVLFILRIDSCWRYFQDVTLYSQMPFHQAFSSIYSYSWKEYWKAIKIILIFIVPHIILNANHSGFEHYYKLLGFCFLIIYSVYFSKLPPFFLMLILSHLWPVRTTSYWLLCLFDTAPLAFDSVFAFFFLVYLFIYLFIFGCVGSSFLCEGFLQLWRAGATLHRGARASHCCGAQAPDAQAQ